MQTAHPSRGVKQHTTFLQIFSARLSGTSVLALTIFFDLGKFSRSLSLTGLLNLRLGSRPPSSSALYPRWSHAFSCYVLCFGHPSPILNASPPPSHLSIKLVHRALSIKFSRLGCSTVPSGRLVPYWRNLCIQNNIASTKSFQLGSRSSIFLFPP